MLQRRLWHTMCTDARAEFRYNPEDRFIGGATTTTQVAAQEAGDEKFVTRLVHKE